jgi:hypothetical protein
MEIRQSEILLIWVGRLAIFVDRSLLPVADQHVSARVR